MDVIKIKKVKQLLIFFLILSANYSFGQNPQIDNKGIRIMFYNVENLFYPLDDPIKRDDEFTPKGTKYWNWRRYDQKIRNVAKTAIALGEWEAPAVLGLCEIESIECLTDLVENSPLKKYKYKILHYECGDKRGIDVALLYRPEFFNLVGSKPFVLNFGPDSRPTRDILYAKGIVNEKDTLHLFVNHWPSRYGGQLVTAPKREKAAETLKGIYDSLLVDDPKANIIAMGDFNDHPDDVSMKDILKAKMDTVNLQPDELVNSMWQYTKSGGTHKYQHVWGVLDQIVLSQNLVFSKNNLYAGLPTTHIFKADWLLEKDDVGMKLNRTYIGFKFHGGYSDHLPIYVDVLFK